MHKRRPSFMRAEQIHCRPSAECNEKKPKYQHGPKYRIEIKRCHHRRFLVAPVKCSMSIRAPRIAIHHLPLACFLCFLTTGSSSSSSTPSSSSSGSLTLMFLVGLPLF